MSTPKASPSASGFYPPVTRQPETSLSTREILAVIDSLKAQVANDRTGYVKKRMKENSEKVLDVTKSLYRLSLERRNFKSIDVNRSLDLLAKRQKDAIDMRNGIGTSAGDNGQENRSASSAVLLGLSIAVKNAVCPIMLPKVKKMPSYTSWIFLDRNQRMAEDQSVVGRKRIYYDQNDCEALIASDSEEEAIDNQDSKKEFRDSEDYVLRLTLERVGFSETTLYLLARSLSRKPCEIRGRYEHLIKSENDMCHEIIANTGSFVTPYIDKDLDAALDSFDNLFCRRCLVFDCRLHGCSQDLIVPTEKQSSWTCVDVEKDTCGPNCYRLIKLTNDVDSFTAAANCGGDKSISKRIAEDTLVAIKKRQKNMTTSDSDSVTSGSESLKELENEDSSSSQKLKSMSSRKSRRKESRFLESDESESDKDLIGSSKTLKNETCVAKNLYKQQLIGNECWKPLEQALCEKGIQIFGRNSCLIARNLMNGLKSCSEIFNYMHRSEEKIFSRSVDGSYLKDDSNGGGVRRRSRFLRRKGRVRRLKYTWKSAGYPSLRKRNSETEEQPYRQYNPCGCQSVCGKECPCHANWSCCEKFCGCEKSCKNRFRGCHCAKSQCQSRQCPCFAAGRDCDPDVCRNCWIDCGHDTIVGPSKNGDNYECMNMKLLLRQQQRVLLGRSDVTGWGAFLKNSVGKHEYIGEYTGELISQYEAEKRGKIYDRVNQSFLFNLNDQFVLDAYRRGDKLKFANHSPNPNCYAKVVLVNGDHRVGIFAKRRINAGEELFYDYSYAPDCAATWARKPATASVAKKATNAPSNGRAKKNP